MKSAVAAMLLASLAAVAQDETVFKVDVRLVRLTATVKDASGAPVGGLDKGDFTVFDNGVQQTISLFERHTSQPLSVAILLDASGSAGKEMKYQTDAVTRFTRALFKEGNPKDTAALLTFYWQVQELVSFTRTAGRFESATRKLRGEAGTSLYDAIFLGAERIEDREGRRVLIVVTDGADTVSTKNYHDVLRAAHDADAVVYGILSMPITNDAGRHIAGEHALTGITRSTGGKMFTPGMNALDVAFDEILRDLRTQYMIGFYPKGVPATKDPFHKIEIRTSRPELRVVSRTGYYGDAQAPGR
ncbi:MAG TPA: VWA domain-containing protein [Bryobacteraceae bacterium]|nr:VWA domain-containing protein [Bryobacteraceae bacterium]